MQEDYLPGTTMNDPIAAYLCVGDSMSIDYYPYLELAKSDPGVEKGVGAGSLLFKNQSILWPEFDDIDLFTKHPGIQFANLATDGATTYDFIGPDYLTLLPEEWRRLPVIVTLTIGGNDLLGLIGIRQNALKELDEQLDNLRQRMDAVFATITNYYPRGIFIYNTIYDPTDGTGQLPVSNFADKLPWLYKLNDHIRDKARGRALLADIHKHFQGHGLTSPSKDRWYWEGNPIEPSARGASEIRRLWTQALAQEDLL